MRILGIDPGSRVTGFGVIDVHGQNRLYVASGCIRTPAGELPGRIKALPLTGRTRLRSSRSS